MCVASSLVAEKTRNVVAIRIAPMAMSSAARAVGGRAKRCIGRGDSTAHDSCLTVEPEANHARSPSSHTHLRDSPGLLCFADIERLQNEGAAGGDGHDRQRH